jgi:hypothetical protein
MRCDAVTEKNEAPLPSRLLLIWKRDVVRLYVDPQATTLAGAYVLGWAK